MQLATLLAAEGDPWSDYAPPSPKTGSLLASLRSGFRRRNKPKVSTERVSSRIDQGDKRGKQRQLISAGRRVANFLKWFRFGSSSGNTKANGEEGGEEAQTFGEMSFRDLAKNSAHFEFQGHDAAGEEQGDFDFDLAFETPRSLGLDMCAAVDIVFMGRILPLRHFSHDIDEGTTRYPSKSTSLDQHGAGRAAATPVWSAVSVNCCGECMSKRRGLTFPWSYKCCVAAAAISGTNVVATKQKAGLEETEQKIDVDSLS